MSKDSDIRRIIEEEIAEEFNNEREQIREVAKENISKITEENRRTYIQQEKKRGTQIRSRRFGGNQQNTI